MVKSTNAATGDAKHTYAASANVELGTEATAAPPPRPAAAPCQLPNQRDEADRVRVADFYIGNRKIEEWNQ